MKQLVKLWLSQDSLDILDNYAYFHNVTPDEIADASIKMMPFYEERTKQIQEFMR